jgi:hypothetical protein
MSREETEGLSAEEKTAQAIYQKKHGASSEMNKSASGMGIETETPASMSTIGNPVFADPNTNANYKAGLEEGFASRTAGVFALYLPLIFAFGMCYTEMGYGATTFKGTPSHLPYLGSALTHSHAARARVPSFHAGLSSQYENYKKLVAAAFGVLFIAYTFDIGEWHDSCWPVLRNVIYALVTCATGTGAMMAFQGYPYMPLALILVFIPICA